MRNLQLVYEAPVQSVTNGGRLNLAAPRLLYRASREAKQSTEIPLVNIEWTVTVPDGYEAVATDGTLEAKADRAALPAPLVVAGALYELGGGYRPHVLSFAWEQRNRRRENRTSRVKAASKASGAVPSYSPTRDAAP